MSSNIFRLINFVGGGNLAKAKAIYEKTDPGDEKDIMRAALSTAFYNVRLDQETKNWISGLIEIGG
ncbi:MAG TPA: hypothetical protein PLK35_02900 [Candidatus Moranbacteria bacterium]|nr:hypothetical protein [Candidatus Moranbacteria bacterium]